MVQSAAKTVAAYLAELPPERRQEIAKVRKAVKAHLPRGYRETTAKDHRCRRRSALNPCR